MVYETLFDKKSGSYNENDTITYTLTFVNNIDHITEFRFRQYSGLFHLTSYTISNNILTVVFTCYKLNISGPYAINSSLLVTAASY
jgi:hypothetical protein